VPSGKEVSASAGSGVYTVSVSGQSYVVEVTDGGDVSGIAPIGAVSAAGASAAGVAPTNGEPVAAPLAGNIFKVNVAAGEHVQQGDVIIILEAMKMETEVRAAHGGVVATVDVKEGDAVAVGDTLITIA
jgi:oxaloacetate decarboxylase alpha subunit